MSIFGMSNNWHILGDLLKNGKSKKIQNFWKMNNVRAPGRNRTRGFKRNRIFVNRGEMGIPDLNKDLNVSSNRNVSLLRNSLITRRNTTIVWQILVSWNGQKCPFQDMPTSRQNAHFKTIDNCWTIVRFGKTWYKYSKMSNNGQKEIWWRMSLSETMRVALGTFSNHILTCNSGVKINKNPGNENPRVD